jgi:hypothetical protein
MYLGSGGGKGIARPLLFSLQTHELYSWQAAALELGINGSNLIYCAPTSSYQIGRVWEEGGMVDFHNNLSMHHDNTSFFDASKLMCYAQVMCLASSCLFHMREP